MDDLDFRVRPGRIGDRGARSRSFIGESLRVAARSGGPTRGLRWRSDAPHAGPGRGGLSLTTLRSSSRRVIIKARVIRHTGVRLRSGPLAAHLRYLKRDGVDHDGAAGRVFDRAGDADDRAFAARCHGDRHHFRLIVSPEDAAEMADLRAFGRDLMARAEADLGARLDWVAVAHWNTAHPHLHALVRGVDTTGADLVIPRAYISQGLRARAEALVTLELGPRSAREIAAAQDREIGAERWTSLDRTLDRLAAGGHVDLRPGVVDLSQDVRAALLSRVAALSRWGLAEPAGTGVWRLSTTRRLTLAGLALQAEVADRLRRAAPDRPVEELVVAGERQAQPLVCRLVARGLHDELTGEGFVILDGLDGRLRHVRVRSLDATGDTPLGGLVELQPGAGGPRIGHRSDLSLAAQVDALGATWLDRRLVAARPEPLAPGGLGAEARRALAERTARLQAWGLARETGSGRRFAIGLLDTLRSRELTSVGNRLAAETGLRFEGPAVGPVRGRYVRRLDLASGRFAMVETATGFRLATWSRALDRHLGRVVSGRVVAGRMSWDLGRGPELGGAGGPEIGR